MLKRKMGIVLPTVYVWCAPVDALPESDLPRLHEICKQLTREGIRNV